MKKLKYGILFGGALVIIACVAGLCIAFGLKPWQSFLIVVPAVLVGRWALMSTQLRNS